jgi:hypothetical protein
MDSIFYQNIAYKAINTKITAKESTLNKGVVLNNPSPK